MTLNPFSPPQFTAAGHFCRGSSGEHQTSQPAERREHFSCPSSLIPSCSTFPHHSGAVWEVGNISITLSCLPAIGCSYNIWRREFCQSFSSRFVRRGLENDEIVLLQSGIANWSARGGRRTWYLLQAWLLPSKNVYLLIKLHLIPSSRVCPILFNLWKQYSSLKGERYLLACFLWFLKQWEDVVHQQSSAKFLNKLSFLSVEFFDPYYPKAVLILPWFSLRSLAIISTV